MRQESLVATTVVTTYGLDGPGVEVHTAQLSKRQGLQSGDSFDRHGVATSHVVHEDSR